MSQQLKGYEYMAHLFEAYGTTHLFYQEMMFLKTIKEAEKRGIKPILTHSEFAAGYMADGYARASGKPGVCLAQAIGAANLAASIQDAWLGCTPVIALTGKKTAPFLYRNAYQDSEHKPFFDALTKFSGYITDPQQMPHLLRQCYKEAVTGKPRPTHLDLPGFFGLELEIAEIQEPFMANSQYGTFPPFRPAADAQYVEQAAQALDAAKNPILVIGRGAIISGAHQAVLDLAQKGDIPVVTTCDGKTIIDEDSPLWAGIVGGYGMDSANKSVAAADLVIFIGTQTSDQTTVNWNIPNPAVKAIQIDIDCAELGRSYPDCIGLPGDARTVTNQLAQAISKKSRPQWRAQVDAYCKDTFTKQATMWADISDPIKTQRLCHEVSQALPDNAIVVSDTGWSAVWSATMIRMKASQKYIRAAGTLGWGYPASIGAKCGAPDRPVVCFTGDGGFYYFSNEMETAVRNNIPTVTVVNNNLALSQIVPSMMAHYPDEPQKGLDRLTFKPVNLAKVAHEFGLFAIRVDKSKDIALALSEALACGKPALVEVMTDPDSRPLSAME